MMTRKRTLAQTLILRKENDLLDENANSTEGMIHADWIKFEKPSEYLGSSNRLTDANPIPMRHCKVMATQATGHLPTEKRGLIPATL
jgi:hypothetical protein